MRFFFWKFWNTVQKGKVLHVRGLLFKTLHNVIIDWRRKHKTLSLDEMVEQGIELQSELPGTEQQAEYSQLLSLLRHLEEIDRAAIVLRFICDCTPQEIGQIMGVSSNAAAVRVHRAMSRLQELARSNEKLSSSSS
jgi:RNA polymerase sigma factor (sigma-70 family)